MNIKHNNYRKTFCLCMIFLFSLTLIQCIIPVVCAQTQISIVDISYDLTKREQRGRIMESWYDVIIVVKNDGDQGSVPIIFLLIENEDNILRNTSSFAAGETKTIVFEWATALFIDQNLTLNYYPYDEEDIARDSYNSGSQVFTVKVVDEKQTQTPGFTLLFAVFAILFVVLVKKKK